MQGSTLLDRICRGLIETHGVHTVLLYGSRAEGSEREDSDYDIAAFGPVATSSQLARHVGGVYLDVFVYPASALLDPSEEHLKLRGSKILMQRDPEASAFLIRLEEIFGRGPAVLPPDEIETRKLWAHKMLARIERADPEGDYRRVWLLQALLEDYFQLRTLWYQGPKKSLQWLETFDLPVYRAFCLALQSGAGQHAIAALVHQVVGPRPGA